MRKNLQIHFSFLKNIFVKYFLCPLDAVVEALYFSSTKIFHWVNFLPFFVFSFWNFLSEYVHTLTIHHILHLKWHFFVSSISWCLWVQGNWLFLFLVSLDGLDLKLWRFVCNLKSRTLLLNFIVADQVKLTKNCKVVVYNVTLGILWHIGLQ